MTSFHSLILGAALLASAQASALGIHKDALEIACSGKLKVASVKSVSATGGFIDRAGNHHPSKGYATFKIEIAELAPGCLTLQSKLQIDLKAKDLETSEFYSETDKAVVAKLAQAKVGQTAEFTAKQSFQYADKDGFLPLFPLLHSENVTLQSSLVANAWYAVDSAQAYGIVLSEEDKVQLTEMIFALLDKEDTNGLHKSSLHLPLMTKYPEFDSNFRAYLQKLLAYFDKIENKQPESPTLKDFDLSVFASLLNAITYKYPEYYEFKLGKLVAAHPSMIYSQGWSLSGKTCPNMSAQHLEEAVDILKASLAANALSPVVKSRWELPLKTISGGLLSSASCVEKLTSSHAKAVAKELLQKYYATPASGD